MSTEKRRNEIKRNLPEAAAMLMERMRGEVPPSGKFQGISVSFSLSETDNIAMLVYEFDVLKKGEQRVLSLGLRRRGSSYIIRIQIFRGTNKETLEFLHFSEEQLSEFADDMLDMSDNADERDERFIK